MPATPVPEGSERVTQLWPKELKAKVRAAAGDRGMSEFTIEAVSIHLGVDQDLTATTKELNEVKHFAQQLADQVVLGIESPEERIQALMELEFPSWISTEGWPAVYAERVRPLPFHEEREKAGFPPVEAPTCPVHPEVAIAPGGFCGKCGPTVVRRDPADEDRKPEPVVEPFETSEPDRVAVFNEAVELTEATPDPVLDANRDDLFARMMAKTGGKLEDVPGLKVASQVEAPAKPDCDIQEPHDDHETRTGRCPGVGPAEEPSGLYVDDDDQAQESRDSGVCPKCGEELVDGECWTCD